MTDLKDVEAPTIDGRRAATDRSGAKADCAERPLPESLRKPMAERERANREYFGRHAADLAALCHRMAERFSRGGRLVALGISGAARSDARHVAVEFVHPVIVGKRALPALALTGDGGSLSVQADLVLRRADMVLAFGAEGGAPAAAERARGELERAVSIARDRGCLTVAFGELGAEREMSPPSEDPFVRQELVETLYHVLWELVHVFFEHKGLLEGRSVRSSHDPGESSFLYPFLGEREEDLDSVLADVRASVLMKADEVTRLRRETLTRGGDALVAAARRIRAGLDAGGTILALGNGGSATDAMDVVADFRDPPGGWPRRPALDLTEDASILTAVGNDVGVDAIFSRQLIAYGSEEDVALAFSTSGSSRNVVLALEEARRRGIQTVAFTGYDGGEIVARDLADSVIVSPSHHIPRIQEAQATAYHLLRALVEEGTAAASPGGPKP